MLRSDRVAGCCDRVVSVPRHSNRFASRRAPSIEFTGGNSCGAHGQPLACYWRENGKDRQQTEVAKKPKSVRIFLRYPPRGTMWSPICVFIVRFFEFEFKFAALSIGNINGRWTRDIPRRFSLVHNEVRICNRINVESEFKIFLQIFTVSLNY